MVSSNNLHRLHLITRLKKELWTLFVTEDDHEVKLSLMCAIQDVARAMEKWGAEVPYKSEAQRKKFHEMAARGEISQKTLQEWDSSSKGLRLPERLKPKKDVKKK